MDYWPSYIPKPSSLSESVDDPYIEATSETGDDSARVRYSKERQGPTKLTWKIMRLGDFVALKQFYADHRAIEFLWLHPSRGLTYKTRFVSSPISSSEDGKSPFVAQVEVTLQIVELAPTEQEQPSASDLMDTINAGADKAVQAAIDAEQARDDAKEYAKKAAASAKEAADTAAEIPAAVEAGIERIEKAGASQISAVNSAGSTQVSKVNSAGTKQTTAVNNAGAAQVSKVNSAGTSQIAAVENAGSEQIAAVKAEGKAQTAAAKKQADAAAASAEEAAERLAEFKDLGATAKTLAAGSNATASFDSSTGVITIGVPSGKKGDKGDKGDPGTFSEDGVTVVANASGEAMAKDVAVGGDVNDLASARGQIGDYRTKLPAGTDLNDIISSGTYIVYSGNCTNVPMNGMDGYYVLRVFGDATNPNAAVQKIYSRMGTAGPEWSRRRISDGTWQPWQQLVQTNYIGDGIKISRSKALADGTGGLCIISVPEMQGATISAAGTSGLVPPAAAGQQESFLTGGGEYKPALTKISDSVNLADSKMAASAKAVKTAYDLAADAKQKSNTSGTADYANGLRGIPLQWVGRGASPEFLLGRLGQEPFDAFRPMHIEGVGSAKAWKAQNSGGNYVLYDEVLGENPTYIMGYALNGIFKIYATSALSVNYANSAGSVSGLGGARVSGVVSRCGDEICVHAPAGGQYLILYGQRVAVTNGRRERELYATLSPGIYAGGSLLGKTGNRENDDAHMVAYAGELYRV